MSDAVSSAFMEDFDTRMDRERAAGIAKRTALVTALLAHLPGWSAHTVYAHIGPSLKRDADGVVVGLGGGGYGEKDRLTASFDWPRDAKGNMHVPSEYEKRDLGNPTTRITVADTTAPADFAKAILRRLMTTNSVALFVKKLREAKGADDYRAKTVAARDALVTVTGGRASHNNDEEVWVGEALPGVYKLRAHGDTVTMELNLPLDAALTVLNVVKGMKRS